ncbi:hypothetical protein [Fusobacterium sp.]|uniref:hypothetical protein n=1 Tax=Fusobacterium sp. TaxID=68766 RepID=UPI000E7E6E4E|nr:hypothetical protein [Fusobacterium sp.]HBJ80197.1 hypothetical protein [Fusobacterium sp.]
MIDNAEEEIPQEVIEEFEDMQNIINEQTTIIVRKIETIISNYLEKNTFIIKDEVCREVNEIEGISDYKIRLKNFPFSDIIDTFIMKVTIKKEILLKDFIRKDENTQSEKILILKGKEAQIFTYLIKNSKSLFMGNGIEKFYFEEAINYLEIKPEELEILKKKAIIKEWDEIIDFNFDVRGINDTYKESNNGVIERIFNTITYVKVLSKIEEAKNKNKKLEIQYKKIEEKIDVSLEKIREAKEKIDISLEKIREAEEKIKISNEKIRETEEKIEKGKIDIVGLLGIFVAIISIIYANISVSSNELSSIVITNISTVVCILFLLGFIEKSIKNENNKIPIGVIWGISLFMSLILIIGMYSYMRYEKNNFIKYMENIYELKNKETTLELQHFTMPSDY